MKSKEELNELSGIIVDAAMEVHREFGPGLLERVYETALAAELRMRGISSTRQVPLPVEDSVVVEIKTVAALLPIHEAQLSTYLRLARKNLGLLINFHTILLKDGIKRRVHQFPSI